MGNESSQASSVQQFRLSKANFRSSAVDFGHPKPLPCYRDEETAKTRKVLPASVGRILLGHLGPERSKSCDGTHSLNNYHGKAANDYAPLVTRGANNHAIGTPELASPGTSSLGYAKKRGVKLALGNNSRRLPAHFPKAANSSQLHQERLHQLELSTPVGKRFGVAEQGRTFVSNKSKRRDSSLQHQQPSKNDRRKSSLGQRTMLNAVSENERKRSRSLCTSQLEAECKVVASRTKQLLNEHEEGKRHSSGAVPPLACLRIQQCFKNARPSIGQFVIRRACMLRPEIKAFLNMLGEEGSNKLAADVYLLISESVANLDDSDRVSVLAKKFGRKHAQLSNYGFRPEFFSVFADATIAECIRLDGGAHKRCETLLAWSQLIQIMFSSVRDGYYAEVRQQRRSSLPQHQNPLACQISSTGRADSLDI